MTEPTSPNTRDTLYPVSPVGDSYPTAPKPMSSDLLSRLDQIGRQDVGAPR